MKGASIFAQEQAIYSQYFTNLHYLNPSLVGFDETRFVNFNFRSAWANFPDRPGTFSLGYKTPIGKTLGLGAIISKDHVASLNSLRGQLSYAFRYEIKDFKLGFGFSTSIKQLKLDSEIATDPNVEADDPVVATYLDGVNYFDASFGIHALYKEKTYFGFVIPNLVRARLDDIDEDKDQGLKYFVVYAGRKIKLEDYDVSLEPSFFIKKIRTAPLELDANIKAGFAEDKVIAGLSMRVGKTSSAGLLLGTNLKQGLSIYYTFDVSFQRFQKYSNGSHELLIGYKF